jgi:GTP:adenosylcobinamide-phosphate guanylyltransferase
LRQARVGGESRVEHVVEIRAVDCQQGSMGGMHTVALIVAAGRGERFGGTLPKQYAGLDGIPVLRRSILAFADHPAVEGLQAVIGPEDGDLYAAAAAGLDLLPPAVGAATRQATVRNGLESLVHLAPAKILIHDAARPLVSEAVIDRVARALDTHAAVLPVVPVLIVPKQDLLYNHLLKSIFFFQQGLDACSLPTQLALRIPMYRASENK